MTATETLSMIMADLLAVLQAPPKTSPVFNHQRELATAVSTLQKILVREGNSEQTPAPITKPRSQPRPSPIVNNTTTRSSRSQPTNLFPIGTIVKKGIHEGEITSYDPVNNYYKVKFEDGDREEYTYGEILLYRKSKQIYSRKKKIKPTTCGPKRHFSNAAFFIPTKANPNPVKKDYLTKH